MLQPALRLAELLRVAEVVEVGQHAHQLREAVHLADVEELERLHLEAEARVHQQQHLRGRDRPERQGGGQGRGVRGRQTEARIHQQQHLRGTANQNVREAGRGGNQRERQESENTNELPRTPAIIMPNIYLRLYELTKSATFAMSIIELISLLHSTIVNLLCFPEIRQIS